MNEKVSIKISSEVASKFNEIAKNIDLSLDKLIEALLDAFIKGDGKIYTGKWDEGPGIRILPDWPRFSNVIIKVKKEEMGG